MLITKILATIFTIFMLASVSQADQKNVDDQCLVSYSQAASRCNSQAGNDDDRFSSCLKPVKAELVQCCNEKSGSAKCAADVISQADQKNVDDQCFVSYSQAAGQCNSEAGDDEVKFGSCLKPVKAELVQCCYENLGSATCAENAK